MTMVTVHEAKTNLSKLIAEVLAGGEVVIAKGKEPAVKLVPVNQPKPKRMPGRLKGKIMLTEAFFEPLSDDELALWNGEDS
jgi:prevent-host-death family protein